MVFKNINRIKTALPEVKHAVMFYNNGTIFQTTFEQSINIPKLGENLAETLNHIRSLYEICNYKMEPYKKLIFETQDMSVIILKLGEESNIALFFESERDKELRLSSIKRYISNIESLIDMDEKELLLQDILIKEEKLKNIKMNLQLKKDVLSDNLILIDKINSGDEAGDIETLTKKTHSLQDEIKQINGEIENLTDSIASSRGQIEGEH